MPEIHATLRTFRKKSTKPTPNAMKTKLLIIGIFSLAGLLASCEKNPITPGGYDYLTLSHPRDTGNDTSLLVYYDVTVHLTVDTKLAGPYEVQLLTGTNTLISSQRYFKNQSVYHFQEQVRNKVAIRIARLLPASLPDTPVTKGNMLYTPPDIQKLTFEGGRYYYFNLYPQYNPPHPPN
jgi:hypothetical protein